jgi:hypothetical protein
MRRSRHDKEYSPLTFGQALKAGVRITVDARGESTSRAGDRRAGRATRRNNHRRNRRAAYPAEAGEESLIWRSRASLTPDSPDEVASGRLRALILLVISSPYAGSRGRVLTDATGERRNRQFRERFRGLRSCRSNPSGESGLTSPIFVRRLLSRARCACLPSLIVLKEWHR